MRRVLPSLDYVNECLLLDAKTGVLTWKQRPRHHFSSAASCARWNKIFPGKQAGNKDRTRIEIRICGKFYAAHHLVWLMINGCEPNPALQIDHIDQNPFNNAPSNLRQATCSQNVFNRTLIPGSTGHVGIRKDTRNGKFYAMIVKDGKSRHLGSFDNIKDAIAKREQVAKEFFGEFCPAKKDTSPRREGGRGATP